MVRKLVLVVFLAGVLVAAPQAKERVFVGVVTDSMCGASHKMMGNTPAPQCTVACVKSNPKEIKYALAVGKNVYTLSDQQTPEKFAGQKVKVTGVLDAKSKTIETKKIEPAAASPRARKT